jgi:hypothetical protein
MWHCMHSIVHLLICGRTQYIVALGYKADARFANADVLAYNFTARTWTQLPSLGTPPSPRGGASSLGRIGLWVRGWEGGCVRTFRACTALAVDGARMRR